MSTRGNPFKEIERFFERMGQQFDETSHWWRSSDVLGLGDSAFGPLAVDLIEHDDEFVVTVDLPGFERDDVDIEVMDHTLRVEAEREEGVDEGTERYLRRERRHTSAQRTIQLPTGVEKEAVTARMKNGVLTVTLPKSETDETRDIEIE